MKLTLLCFSLIFLPVKQFSCHAAGQTAQFEVALGSKPDTLVWLKDNKPMNELLSERGEVAAVSDTKFKMELKNCVESDSGTYTALASNQNGKSSSSAQLLVHERKY